MKRPHGFVIVKKLIVRWGKSWIEVIFCQKYNGLLLNLMPLPLTQFLKDLFDQIVAKPLRALDSGGIYHIDNDGQLLFLPDHLICLL